MDGYVARKGERWYAVIYEGLDPVTGKERRTWHPAGTSRDDAVRLAAALAEKVNGRNDQATRSIPTRSPRPSNGSPTGPGSPESGSMTFATPTAPCSSKPASRSKSSRNGSGTATRRSPSTPTSTSYPACKPKQPAPSNS